MTYKVAVDLGEMNSSRLSQREFIQLIKENYAAKMGLPIEDIQLIIIGQQPLQAVKGAPS